MNQRYECINRYLEVFNQYGFEHSEDEQFIADEDHVIRLVAEISDHLQAAVFVVDGDIDLDIEEGKSAYAFFIPIPEGYGVNKKFKDELKKLITQKLDGDVTVSGEEDQMWMTLFPKAGFGDEVEMFSNSMEIMTSDEVINFIDTVEDNLYKLKGSK